MKGFRTLSAGTVLSTPDKGVDVVDTLDRMASIYRLPKNIRMENGFGIMKPIAQPNSTMA